MSTVILEKIKVRKLYIFFKNYRKFRQQICASSIPLRFFSLRAFALYRKRYSAVFVLAQAHLSPCQFDSASLLLTAGFRPIQEKIQRCFCASTNSAVSFPLHGSMLIVKSSGFRRSRPEGLHLSECSLSSHHYCISHMHTYQSIRFL